MRLVPKNWTSFQHYKDRCPPWIKLHRDLLNDRAYMMLPIASKALAPLLWLLASESKSEQGDFDASIEELEFRLRLKHEEIESGLRSLIDKGFFIVSSGVLAERLQPAIPETEREAEKETEKEAKREKKASPTGSRLPADWALPDDWAIWAKQERPDLNPNSTAERFADYWHGVAGAKGRKADWHATWRNWVRAEKKQPVGASNGLQTAPMSFAQVDEMARRKKWEEMTGRKWPESDGDVIEAEDLFKRIAA